MKKNNKRKYNYNKNKKTKYMVIISCFVLLITILITSKLKPTKLLGNLYNINDVEKNIGKIKVGDIINYEINGYSNWQVVSVDKENGTLDVVSKTNVEDVTLTSKEDYKNALDIFQTTANKYTDNKYAIKARSVTRADLDNFGFDEVFWNADIYDEAVAFTDGRVKYNATEDGQTEYQFLPYVLYKAPNAYTSYNLGDEYNVNLNGIDKWIIVEQPDSRNENIMLIPSTPIPVTITDEEFANNPQGYLDNILVGIKEADSNVVRTGNIGNYYGFDLLRNNYELKNHFMNQSSKYSFFSGSLNSYLRDSYIELGFDTYNIDYDEDTYEYKWINYNKEIPVTKGFRPIVTLKFSDKLVDGKSLKSALKIGDYVDYNAKEYYNWRVLSIDEKNSTVDIVSGGIVKNLKLYGIDNFDNYEQIIQDIANEYKVGKNAISARIVEYTDLPNLNKMNDKVNVKYWTGEKKDYNKKAVNDTSSPYATNAYYDASIMFYDINESSIQRRWVSLYISSGLNSGGNAPFSNYNGTGDLSFTAGIRPVITLKLDSVKKLDDDKVNEVINNSKSNQNKMSNEQMINSNSYITKDHTTDNNYFNIINRKAKKSNDDSGNELSNDEKSIETDKDEVNEYHNESNGKNDKLVKYIIIAIVVLNLAIIVQIIISTFIIKNIKDNK